MSGTSRTGLTSRLEGCAPCLDTMSCGNTPTLLVVQVGLGLADQQSDPLSLKIDILSKCALLAPTLMQALPPSHQAVSYLQVLLEYQSPASLNCIMAA